MGKVKEETRVLQDAARDAVMELQFYMCGRIRAWDFPYSRIAEYKAAFRPPRWGSSAAALQDTISRAMRYADHMEPAHRDIVKQLLIRCRRRNDALVEHCLPKKPPASAPTIAP